MPQFKSYILYSAGYVICKQFDCDGFFLQDSVKKLEENVADFGRISEKLLSKFGKVICC